MPVQEAASERAVKAGEGDSLNQIASGDDMGMKLTNQLYFFRNDFIGVDRWIM